MRIFIFILGVLVGGRCFAYPDFIGYGYSSCLTCHWNGMGGWALNDYGRALWSAEIASRALYSKSTTDEKLGEASGFIPGTELPWWIRPSLKYRGLSLQRSLGASDTKNQFYHMQLDVGTVISFDRDYNYILNATYGYMPPPGRGTENNLSRSRFRELYFRAQPIDTWWLYAGLLEKVYGIRNIDHTSYSRQNLGLNQRAISNGVIVHKVEEKWEAAFNIFAGNPDDQESIKTKGVSFLAESDVGEAKRLGITALDEKSDVSKQTLTGIFYKQKISHGSSFSFEYGLLSQTATGADTNRGSYNVMQTLILLTRGYHLKINAERINQDFSSSSADQWRFGTGFLIFPMPRFEIRTEVWNSRSFLNTSSRDDSWNFQGQIHASF